jgi:glutamate dehydrogenase (NADP+)
VAEGANMPSTPEAVEPFSRKLKSYSHQEKHLMRVVWRLQVLEMSQNSLRLSWTTEEVDESVLKGSCSTFMHHV